MKKRLLFAAMAMLASVSSFALEVGEFVYTPQGRFQITGSNFNTNSTFQDWSGWTVLTATEGKTIDDIFTINANGYAQDINSVSSLDATAGEGMYFKFEPTSAGESYVVSFKMKAETTNSSRVKTDILKTNLVVVQGNADNIYGGTAEAVVVNRAEDLTSGDWQTFNYAIVGDEIARTYFISFTGMSADVQIADLQIASAVQVADLRQRDAMIKKMEVYKNCYAWDSALLDDVGFDENLGNLQAIGDGMSQAELDENLGTCSEVIDEFLKKNMEDYLASSEAYYMDNNVKLRVDNKFNTWYTKIQKATTWGDWTCFPAGRGFWEKEDQGCADLGHYAGSQKWGDMVMGVSTQKELSAGAYVFAIEGRAALRENNSSGTWLNNDGLRVGIATAYVVKVPAEGVEASAADTIAVVHDELDPLDFTTSIVAANITEAGNYEIGYKVVLKESCRNITAGGVTYVRNASIWGKNENIYSQKQLVYEANVRAQITAGRDNLNTAAAYLADESYAWGKSDLQAAVNEIEPLIAAYEAMSQDDIIATFDESVYEAGATNENALLEHEVYDTATKLIIAANRTFLNRNNVLASLQSTIDNASTTLNERIYDAATGKDDLVAAIETAKGILADMKATDYSEENEATVNTAIAELNEAIATFKTTIPATAITEIISVDFESGATQNAETGLYEVTGTNTVMTIENFSETTPIADEKGIGDMTFELGLDSNGEKVLPGVLRVGNGSATATIPAKEYGTNILKVAMDFWFIRLSDGHVGFDLLDEAGERVAGLYFVPYNNNLGSAGYDDFAIANIGGFFPSNTTGDAGSCVDGNRSHIECILDYGEGTMYLTSTNASGVFATDKVAFSKLAPATFTVKSNYKNYIGRRCWFDNLKIDQIAAGPVNGISEMTVAGNAKAAVYNLAGQKLTSAPAKGMYIQGGKKFVVK